MTDKLRFGIIGCGRIAPRHADSLRDLSANVVSFADVVETRAAKFAKDFGGAAVHKDYRRILDDKSIDVVNICTPSGMHAEMTVAALDAGKHVIVEKPIALSLDDADRMLAAAERNRKKLCVVLQNRYNPPMVELRQAVDEGRLGKLLLGNATVRWYRPQEYYQDGWHGTWSMDGGALMNQSIHHIDALQWLMGDVESVFAYTATLAHTMEAEDTGVAVLRFKNGAIGSIEGSTITYPENLEGSVAIFGEHGSLKVGGTALNRKVFWKIGDALEHEREMLKREEVDPPSVYGQSHKAVMADMVDAIATDREPRTHGREARKSLALVLAIYESSRSGRPVQFA